MKRKKKLNVSISFTTAFYSYDKTRKNNKAKRDIQAWVKSMVDEMRFIPLYVDTIDEHSIEDTTEDIKDVKVRVVMR